jgi:quinol monooxygenase YgiN
MYTATMQYLFRDEAFDQACEIWKTEILEHAQSHAGFVRMQFLTARPKAMAIGTWEDNKHARAFMETGAFKALMAKLQPLVVGQPEQTIWDLRYFASGSTRA